MKDVIIIGGGIIGSTLFYELSKTSHTVLLLEKEANAGLEVSKYNSHVIHNGLDPKDGTLKKTST